jgi:hypothetical protein
VLNLTLNHLTLKIPEYSFTHGLAFDQTQALFRDHQNQIDIASLIISKNIILKPYARVTISGTMTTSNYAKAGYLQWPPHRSLYAMPKSHFQRLCTLLK